MKKFSIRTCKDLQAALKNLTTREEIEAVFNDTTLEVLRSCVDNVDSEYKKYSRAEVIETLVEWKLDEIADLQEIEKFKALSFDEQVTYLKSVSSGWRFELIKLMDIAQMEAKIYEVYPEQAEQLKSEFTSFGGEHLIFCWFERAIADKRIAEQKVELVKKCRTKQELTELLSTCDKKTITEILKTLGIRDNFRAREKINLIKLCIDAIECVVFQAMSLERKVSYLKREKDPFRCSLLIKECCSMYEMFLLAKRVQAEFAKFESEIKQYGVDLSLRRQINVWIWQRNKELA